MIKFMRNAGSPYLTDLLAISLRWLALFGLSISLGTGGVFLPGGDTGRLALSLLVLAVPTLWNGFLSALAIFNRRLPGHRYWNVGIDVVSGAALFFITGGLYGQVTWVALLPLFSAAVYFDVRGAFLTAAGITLVQFAITLVSGPGRLMPLAAGALAAGNLTGALLVTLLSAPLVHRLHRVYQTTIKDRSESERNVQRQERERMHALFEMIETLSATLNYQTVMETLLDTAMGALGEGNRTAAQPGTPPEQLAGAVLLFGDNSALQINASRGFIARDTSVTLPGDEGALSEALKTGEARLVESPGQDPELSRLVTMQSHSAGLCLPLIRGMNAYGMLVFGHPDKRFFTPDRVETLQMLGNQAIIALQNARLYQDLNRDKERIVQSQDEAQKKLARDLHDGPTQSVAAIAMRIGIARRLLQRSSAEADEELVKIEDLARRTTQEIRHMLFTLRPLVLESQGVAAALNTMADKMFELYQQKVAVEVQENVLPDLDSNHQSVIFFLAEEAVNNARKHAKADTIRVRLISVPKVPDILMLEIADNGIGFDLDSVMNSYDRRGSLGMVNLRERADQINGLLNIESAPGKGTRIRIFIPMTPEAADRLHQSRGNG
jgi:signal transduction histidine kinase